MSSECTPNELQRLRERLRELEASGSRAREQVAALLKERDEFLGFLARAPYGVMSISARGPTVYLNREFSTITGYGIKDLPNGRSLLRKAFPNKRYRNEVLERWRTSIEELTSTTFSLVRKDGATREVEFRPSVLGDGSLVLMVFDVTDRKRWEDAIRHMAYHDALTNLPNRILLNNLLTSALSRAKSEKEKLGIMIIDLDNLKETNDRHGHMAGDVFLRTVASRITDLLRVTDTVARVGGDEFIILLPSLHSCEDVVQIAEKIIQALGTPVAYRNQPLNMTASLGAALYPDDGEDAETLITKADKAMYEAKRRGDKKYFVCGV